MLGIALTTRNLAFLTWIWVEAQEEDQDFRVRTCAHVKNAVYEECIYVAEVFLDESAGG